MGLYLLHPPRILGGRGTGAFLGSHVLLGSREIPRVCRGCIGSSWKLRGCISIPGLGEHESLSNRYPDPKK